MAGVPGRYRAAGVLPMLWVYALMVGLRPSVVRAMLMFTGLACAPLAGRPRCAATVLLACAGCYLVYAPGAYASMGTLLTFVSVCSLLGGAPVLDRVLQQAGLVRDPAVYDFEHRHQRYLRIVMRYLLHIACGTGAIWLLTWPITLTRSNLVTPGAWLVNLMIIPLLSVVLGLGFAAALCGLAVTWLGNALLACALELLHILVGIMELVARMPGSFFALRCLTPWRLFCYYGALVLTWVWARQRVAQPGRVVPRVRLLGAAACVLWLLFARPGLSPQPRADAARVVALDVGLGDAAVIHGPGGETLVIDGGSRFGPWSQGSRVVVPYLRHAGIHSLDAVVCSHFDRDHCGGLLDVLETVRVKAFCAPPRLGQDAFAERLQATAAARGVPWLTWCAGHTQQIGSLVMIVTHPPATITNFPSAAAAWGDNMWSLVLRLESGRHTVLFTGDATRGAEALQHAAGWRGAVDVLKVGHHGSATSTGRRLLDTIRPALSVISVGANHKTLPARRVVERLARRGIPIARTDRGGALELVLGPDSIAVSTFTSMPDTHEQECTKQNATGSRN
jgi:competence protein ComEC